jgi:hypothetical protein
LLVEQHHKRSPISVVQDALTTASAASVFD